MKKGMFYIMAFLVFWTILSERLTISSTIAGLVLSGAIYAYVHDAYKGVKLTGLFKLGPLWILFLLQLVWAIVIANFQVAMIVLSKDLPISPEIVEYETKIKSDLLKTILANSITLTPGTMTVDISDNKLQIHCLSRAYAESLEGNAFERTLLRIQEAQNDK